jgi:hypothetical protein
MPETVTSPTVPLLHDLRLAEAPWIGARDLAERLHRSTEERYRRLYRLQLIRLAPEYPAQIYRDPERGWQIEPGFAAAVFGIPLPPPDQQDPQRQLCATELLDFTGDPAVVYHARRIREAHWIQVVRELANGARRGISPEQISRRRRDMLLLFNEHLDPTWWLARNPYRP